MSLETIAGRKYILEIDADEDAESPRAWDNLGTLVCWHRRYALSDKKQAEAFDDPEDFLAWAKTNRAVFWPVWMYEHGSVQLSIGTSTLPVLNPTVPASQRSLFRPEQILAHIVNTNPFSCPWDSGLLGFIYTTREKLREEFGVKRVIQKVIERVYEIFESELEVYTQYINGDVYCFTLYERDEETGEAGESLDSCCGFFGSDWEDNGMTDYLGKEAQEDLKNGEVVYA